MLGPLLPGLIERWHIQDAAAGVLFTAFFAGQLSGSVVASFRLRLSVIFGSLLTAAGCFVMPWAAFGVAHVTLFFVGLGIGASLTAGNVLVGTAVSSGRARLLALLNVCWSLGAISCPSLLRFCGPRLFFLITGTALALAGLVAVTLPPQAESQAQPKGQTAPSRLPLSLLPLLLFALSLMLFVGIESTLGGWLPSYAVRKSAVLLASSISLYFWLAELAGRMLMAAIVQRLGEVALYRAALVVLIGASATLAIEQRLHAGSIVLLAVLCGLAIAPLYPLIVSLLLARTGRHPHLGPLFATASLGGATLPWLTGVTSTRFHQLSAGLAVPVIGAITLLAISGAITGRHEAARRA